MTTEEFLKRLREIVKDRSIPDDIAVKIDDLIVEFESLQSTEFRFEAVLDVSSTRFDVNIPDDEEHVKRMKRMKTLMESDAEVQSTLENKTDGFAELLFDEKEPED